MWINKSHLLAVGVPPITASRNINMLNRNGPSKTIKPTTPPRGIGRIPTKNFDLDYSIKISKEMEHHTGERVDLSEWKSLREALEQIKRTVK